MTRKHFIAIADALRVTRPPATELKATRQWEDMVDAITSTLSRFNDSFDRQRFREAVNKL